MRRRRAGPRRRARGRGPPGRGHLLAQGVRAGHPAVPRPLPLLHVRGDPGAGRARGPRAVPLPRRDPRDRPGGRGGRLPRGAVHPRRPPRGPLARGAGVARRAGLRLDAGLRPGDGGAGAGGDRAAAAPQPRRHVVGGDDAAQAGVALARDDARDHVDAGSSRPAGWPTSARPTRTPRCGCGCWRTPAGSSVPFTSGLLVGIGETLAERAETVFALRRVAPAVRRPAGGHRPELPRQARHRDAARRRPRARRVPRGDRGHPARARPEGAGAGAAQPRRPGASAGRCSTPASTTGAASRRSPPTT